MDKVKFEKDIIIPKGTEFENCDGEKTEYASGNFSTMIEAGKDGVIKIYLDEEAITYLKSR